MKLFYTWNEIIYVTYLERIEKICIAQAVNLTYYPILHNQLFVKYLWDQEKT